MSTAQAKLLRFAIQYRDWNHFGEDRKATIQSLARHGLIEVNWKQHQFRLISERKEL